jgi:hypothetical protein
MFILNWRFDKNWDSSSKLWGKPHFIYRTFAEYYVVDYLVNRLTEGNCTSQQVRLLYWRIYFWDSIIGWLEFL